MIIKITVEYCNEYLGYTLYSWLQEVIDIVEIEHCVEIELGKRKACREGVLDPVLYIDNIPILEGIPGEPGYLIEVLKKALDNLGYRCLETMSSTHAGS